MIKLVVSGGQTGADRAGWRAARAFGVATAGWMPRGFMAEDGPHPEFKALFNALEFVDEKKPPALAGFPTPARINYKERTEANVRLGDVTALFGDARSPGSLCAVKACRKYGREVIPVGLGGFTSPALFVRRVRGVAERLNSHSLSLNVAGDRESTNPGVGRFVESYLCEVFEALGLVRVAGVSGENADAATG